MLWMMLWMSLSETIRHACRPWGGLLQSEEGRLLPW